jgi:endonuclease III
MKNSKAYAKKIQSLYRGLKRKCSKTLTLGNQTVIDAMVYAVISEKMTCTDAETAIKKLTENFVDMNDLRVARVEEITEALGENTGLTKDIASKIVNILQIFFNQYHKINLESLKKIGKRPARQALEKIEGMTPFIIDYCMLMALQGHSIPLT